MPWGRVDDTYYDHPKLEQLEHVGEWPDRLAAAGLNSLAWSWCNRFLTDGKVPRATVSKLGGTTDLADMLVSVGLWESAPGGYQIHDFLVYNDSADDVRKRRADEAARKARWRATKRPGGTDNGTASVDDDAVPPGVPPSVTPGHGSNGVDVPVGVPASVPVGVPGFHARATRSANPDPSRPDPSRPTESLTRESRATSKRADIAALLERGWPKVTRAQRRVLDEVLARHDKTGAAFAAEVIRATPVGSDPLEAVMDADRMWQDSERSRSRAAEADWLEVKAQERAAPRETDPVVKSWIATLDKP